MHRVSTECVARDRRHEGGVDATGETEHHRGEAVLAGVVAQPENECGIDVRGILEAWAHRGRLCVVRRHRVRREDRLDGPAAVGQGDVKVDHQQLLDELLPAGEHGSVRGDDERVTVEHQLVLSADGVEVRERAAGLRGSTSAQLESDVVLVALIGRTVGHEEETWCAERVLRDRPAVLPEVLTDREGDVDPANPDDDGHLARHEVAKLVEDPVVGQVVLGIASDDRALVQDRNGVLRRVSR